METRSDVTAVLKTASQIAPPSHSDHKGSYAYLLTHDATRAAIEASLGVDCSNALKDHYLAGRTLISPALNQAGKGVLDWGYASGKKSTAKFYHWTRGMSLPKAIHSELNDRRVAHRLNLSEGRYEEIFFYLRQNAIGKGEGIWRGSWFVAEDPESSKMYGDKLIAIDFDGEAKVLGYMDPAWKPAVEEFKKQYPDLAKKCRIDSPPTGPWSYECSGYDEKSKLSAFQIMAEDSGIDIIDYAGCAADIPHQWFMVLSPRHISGTTLLPDRGGLKE